MKIIITTGGTGGHVIPALSIANDLKDNNIDTIITTDKRGTRYINDNYNSKLIHVANINNKIFFFASILIAIAQSIYLIIKYKPNYIISFSGYFTVPIVLAAIIMRVPIIMYELNSVLGKANRLFAKFAKIILTTYPDTQLLNTKTKTTLVKMPTSTTKYKYTKPEINQNITIVITGGSQGAKFLSTNLCDTIIKLPRQITSKLQLFHQVRPELINEITQKYNNNNINAQVSDFFINIRQIIAQSNLFITRAGAGSITDGMVTQCPMILIPLPSSSDNHQYYNAKHIEITGCGWMIEQKNCINDNLINLITNIINEPKTLTLKKHAITNYLNNSTTKNLIDILK